MRKSITMLFFLISMLSCSKTVQSEFSEDVLNEEFISFSGTTERFGDILARYEGQQILIDIWASWCKDCIVGLPELRALQMEKPEVVYLFLSADRKEDTWKRAIKKHEIEGDHYFMPNGTKGLLGNFVDIDWIPRYMIVDSKGQIKLFEAIKADDPSIRDMLN